LPALYQLAMRRNKLLIDSKGMNRLK